MTDLRDARGSVDGGGAEVIAAGKQRALPFARAQARIALARRRVGCDVERGLHGIRLLDARRSAKVAHLTRVVAVAQQLFQAADERRVSMVSAAGMHRVDARRPGDALTFARGEGIASMEDLLLWRWSTLVQITSAWMLMVFFIVVRRSTGRRER